MHNESAVMLWEDFNSGEARFEGGIIYQLEKEFDDEIVAKFTAAHGERLPPMFELGFEVKTTRKSAAAAAAAAAAATKQ